MDQDGRMRLIANTKKKHMYNKLIAPKNNTVS